MGVPLMNDRIWGYFGIAVVTALVGGSVLIAFATWFFR